MLSSTMSLSFNPLDPLGDHLCSPPSSLNNRPSTSRPTFTRIARTTPANNNDSTSLSPPSKPTYFSLKSSNSCSLSPSQSLSSECIAKPASNNSHNTSSDNNSEKHSRHGLNNPRPSLHVFNTSDFLEDFNTSLSSPSSFQRHDRKGLQFDPALVLLSQDELAEKHVASSPSLYTNLPNRSNNTNRLVDNQNNEKAASKPLPTFTRIGKPHIPTTPTTTIARTGFYRLGNSGNNQNSANQFLSESNSLLPTSSSSLQEERKPTPSLSLSTSSPSTAAASPWSPATSPSLSSSTISKPSTQPSLKVPTLHLPPLSLSLSPPPSSVPSLSSSASSACSSASSSSSPSTSHFLFPTDDWWKSLGSAAAPALEQDATGTGSRTSPGTGSGSSPNLLLEEDSSSPRDYLSCLPSSNTFYRQQPQSKDSLKSDTFLLDNADDSVVDHLAFIASPTNSGSQGPTKDSHCSNELADWTLDGTPNSTTTPSTRKISSLARARAPSPPSIITGFCSISKTPIQPSGEPSPQDFLGEADLPIPLPSTLHERQTRQRKRAEQLRQLKIREETEAQEKYNNRRKAIRNRIASFTTGMVVSPSSSPALSHPLILGNNSSSTPSSPALSYDSPRMQQSHHYQPNTSLFRSATWHQQRQSLNQHLKRAPSSPSRGSSSVNNFHQLNRHSTSNIGQITKDREMLSALASLPSPLPRRRVAFDLDNIQVFEYDASGDDWSSSSGPSSPTVPPASCNGRDSYIRYVPTSDGSSSGSSSDEESSSPRIPKVRDSKSKATA